ncbi:hypothetical protein FQN60_013665 [Etheostoma spectabile]|uniref:Uncharacterized protein n=1 Tax=Etheostoma spectabile TaxID=54343 RepID=A0A5J5CG53_9PERO|nr:hypothetical protein FQN60_013665 [Etheostoma spectabile]
MQMKVQKTLLMRMKSSCVRLNQMTPPLTWRKQRTSLDLGEATLYPRTKKTCWRETWDLALFLLSQGRPEAPGVTPNPVYQSLLA